MAANAVSTSTAMVFSFLANGRYTFGADRLTLQQAVLFVATTGTTMWLVQPLAIQSLLRAADAAGTYPGAPVVLIAKLLAIALSVCLNFVAYRFVVWRPVRSAQPQQQP